MKNAAWMLALFPALLVIGCSDLGDKHFATASGGEPAALAADDVDADDGDDEAIALDLVPESVKRAALAAVPGLVLQAAEKELEGSITVYSLAGRVGNEEYEVEVSADGRVREIEKGEESDDGDDRDDD